MQVAHSSKTDTDTALEIENLHKRFGSLEVLKGVSLTARKGEVISLIGSSGSGKSTILRCINLLEMLDSGIVRVNGETIGMLPRSDRCRRFINTNF